ncbi:response regulator [Cohnella phaseoli]|uniref:YesN/AraC family two-component response regulator n=1 Tax=Cohnella phaseoli TaxID=456490 RepID=A0A3D9KF86_9BACL|nr:response regulator [Cohnella phaseoli]RED85109.1 YesN/AraC family two-component response regulator [Cohnella phaseoli]
MWTILLVEDEGFVREAIRELLDWESHGYCVAGEAGNGEEALAAILELKPDVVIADIVMPGMDGIELLKETRKAGIRSRFIMLTAMNHFDYARDALQYGASNYLLKLSLNDDVLLESLGRIKEELLAELRGAGEALYPFYHRIWAGIQGTGAAVQANLAELTSSMEKFRNLSLDIVVVLSGGVPASLDQAGIWQEGYLLVQSFHDAGQTTFFCWKFRKKGDSAEGNSLVRLPDDWLQAVNRLNGDWYGQEAYPAAREGVTPIEELEVELIRSFEELNEAKCAEAAAQIWEGMKASSLSHVEVKKRATHLLHILTMLAGRKTEDETEVYSAVSHESLLAHALQAIRELIRHKREEDISYTDHPEVNRVIQYMAEHYKENIKVTDLARLVAINVDYLSTVFGKKTGLTPIAYLRNLRIEQAKRLLLHSKLSVEEIASQTGFTDDAYFIKTFKRLVGQTPSSFRREKKD